MTDTYAYTAFGELHAQTGSTPNPYPYTTNRYDAATAQYYLRAREYDPAVGRFLSRDTWAIDTWHPVELNRYVYTVANPVLWSDPSGRIAMERGLTTTKIPLQVDTIVVAETLESVTVDSEGMNSEEENASCDCHAFVKIAMLS